MPRPRPLVRRPGGPRAARGAVLGLVLALGACASLPGARPEPPEVRVAGVRPLSLGLGEQRLELRLRVANPNPYPLPLRSLDFVASLAGERFASGRSDERVTIPADGEAIVAVEVVTGVERLFGRLGAMLERRRLELDYDVSGSVRLVGWPGRIPFDAAGVLEGVPEAGS